MWWTKSFSIASKDVYDDSYKKIRMVKLYKPYVFFKAVYVISWPFVYFTWSTFFSLYTHENVNGCFRFDDTNTKNLLRTTKDHLNMETTILEFDPTSINWSDYMMHTHIPGLVKYAMK